jgi:hypothetical protein
MPHYAALSHAEANAIHILREMADAPTRKKVKAQIFARAKIQFGIPADHKLVVEVDTQVAGAGTLKNKATRETYLLSETTGKWVNATNGTTGQRWFKLPADALYDAIIEAQDSADANGDNIASQADKPAGATAHPKDDAILLDRDGSIWVQRDADTYGDATDDTPDEEEEDDDHPY